jgi:UMF1 family MFS transporter
MNGGPFFVCKGSILCNTFIMHKKKLFLWSLYDFANSIVFVNFLLYFGTWLVVDGGLSDFWYNAVFAIATLMLIFSAPLLASYTDKHGGRKYFLTLGTIGTFVSYGCAALFAFFDVGSVYLVALFFLLGQYCYQLSFVFYNAMLEDIADVAHRSRASGIGQFANALGQVVGILATISLASSRTLPVLVAVGIFFVLALPMLVYYKDPRPREKNISWSTVRTETKLFKKNMWQFFSASVATPMLVAFFLFNDGIVTMSNNYSLYMERVFATPDAQKSLLLVGVLGMSAIGGVVAGWLGDKIGLLRTLKYILFGWVILLPCFALAPTFKVFAALAVFAGLFIGSVWAVSRAYMSTILNKENMGYGFAFYTLAERFATFLGPLGWGVVVSGFGSTIFAYRGAMMSMTIFILAGFLVLVFWKRKTSLV